MSNCKDAPFIPPLQNRPFSTPDRRMTTKHVRKPRKIRFSQSRSSPVRSASTPTTRSHSGVLEEAHEHFNNIQRGISLGPTCVPSYTHALVDQPSPHCLTPPGLQQSSTVSSWSSSGNTLWSSSNFQSSANSSATDTSCLATPGLTISDTDSSFMNLEYVVGCSTSSLDSEAPEFSEEKLHSRGDASDMPYAGHRPRLWVDTTFEGSLSDFCDSPIESNPNDDFPHSVADDRDVGHKAGTPDSFKSQFYGAYHHCVAGLDGQCSSCFNELEASFASNAVPAYLFEDTFSNQASAPWCPCHWLLQRPESASPEPRLILSACSLYFWQMRKSPKTLLRRLQDMFEAEWHRVRQAVPSLQKHVQQVLSLILDINPTLPEGLRTLQSLNSGQPPPSLQGYISLAFFAKAWLSLEEQPGLSEVNSALFVETARCVARMASRIHQPAYDMLLQLLWNPFIATALPPESRALHCPTPTPSSVDSSKISSGTQTTPHVRPKWILSHVSREIVEILVYQSPSFGPTGTIELLSASVRNTRAQYTFKKKVAWLIDVFSQSGKDWSATECSQCGQRFTGKDQVKNCNQHLARTCSVTQSRPNYQRVRCPHKGCEVTFTRSDNLHPHMKRKHPMVSP